jgi:hypothetical protein
MISNIAPPQIPATTGLELAAGLFTKCCSELASQLTVSLIASKSDSQRTPLRIGINGDVMGGMRAPVEIGKKRVDIAYVNPSAIVAMAFRGKGYYKQKKEYWSDGVVGVPNSNTPVLQHSNTPALFMGGDRELSDHRPAVSQDR